ncbi:L,D-transpeptidase [Methylacidimicrobium tartarophylax]|uniref:Putative L,D-transpeptidase YbiS n=1 Tax=Methylacidimicrobium tartarophylax TaxID=1041768 RepID=A0A5E6MBA6_9BACT|nr:L,D-transpeptidase [Methylacidimicrobium tartarophylax]VVM05609.1 putative L,D-transpeptidase YbiS [Methylacidimicrobium tartarophylax]
MHFDPWDSSGLPSTPAGIWFHVSVWEQKVRVLRGKEQIWETLVSTALFGCGEEPGSYRTPRGWHFICEKIGEGSPLGTEFRGRRPTGLLWTPDAPFRERSLILTRILWLAGMEPHNLTTRERFIYFHGTNREDAIGQPMSKGCICLRNEEMVQLFEQASIGTRVLIEERGSPL